MSARFQKSISQILLAASVVVCGWLGWHQIQLREETESASAELGKVRDNAAIATLNNLALPSSRDLNVCNSAAAPVTVSALAAVYGGRSGDLKVFNSARQGWQTWTIPARREQPMQLDSAEGGWAGKALFYAIDVQEPGGTERMLAGTSDELTSLCIPLFDGKR